MKAFTMPYRFCTYHYFTLKSQTDIQDTWGYFSAHEWSLHTHTHTKVLSAWSVCNPYPRDCRPLKHELRTHARIAVRAILRGRPVFPGQVLTSCLVLNPLIGTQKHIWSCFIENDFCQFDRTFWETKMEPERLTYPCLSARDSASPGLVPQDNIAQWSTSTP